jgi:hypothetical protein
MGGDMKHVLAANEYSRSWQSLGRQVRRMLVLLAVFLAAFGVLAAAASADGPVHIKRTFGPIVGDFPAGTLCNFAYHEEDAGTQNIKRFFDEEGNLIRVEDQVEVTILHQNVDTGLTLTEVLHYAVTVDFVTGEVTVTGESWHLRNEDGRLVLAGAGLIVQDLFTGEILTETPNAKATDSAETNCTALGGAPAS